MYEGKTVAVVIPAYNEEAFVAGVIETVPDFVDRIYPVDDASTDDTWAEIEAAADRVNRAELGRDSPFDERVVPLQHGTNRGVGGAIKTGYLRAREDEIDVTAVMGGDGQMRPEALELIVEPVATGRADYAKGNRLLDEQFHADMPRFRYVGNRILTLLTKIASGYWDIGDPQNGYTAISLEALEAVEIEEMYEFYGYCNDLLVKLNVAGMRVIDVPRQAVYDDEESHIDYRTYIPRVSGMLARNTVWRIWTKYVVRERHPLAVLAGVATLGGAVTVSRVLKRAVGAGDDQSPVQSAVALCGTALLGTLAIDREHDDHLDGQAEWKPESDSIERPTTEEADQRAQIGHQD
jgi:glycosyltransferase involved in cell wall biosynthesis